MDDRKTIVSAVIDTSLVADMTVREVECIDYTVRKAGGSANAGVDQRIAIAAMYMWKNIRKYRYSDAGVNLTIRQLLNVAQDTRVRFLQQHIINYAAFYVLRDFYDWLCDKKYINRPAEGFWRKIDRVFADYQRVQKSFTEQSTWMTFLDHMRLSYNSVSANIAAMETNIRDYLIQHRSEIVESGQKDDIALLQKAATSFVLLTAMIHSYRDYFIDIIKVHGVDFSAEFSYAFLGKIISNAVWMCEKLGVRFEKDKDGDTVLVGVNINNSVRVNSAWSAIVNILGDDKVLDETAASAISLNPEEKKKFDAEMARENAILEAKKQEELEEGFRLLQDKYNVKKAS